MPSPFSISLPATFFQIWFVVYLYLVPFMLYATWACLAVMDLCEREQGSARLGLTALVVLAPLLGGGWYLVSAARSMNRPARFSIVAIGLLVWLLPLAIGLWLAGGPLGPKALGS